MSVYDNKTSKVYPDLNPMASSQQEVNPSNYRLAKISKMDAYFLNVSDKREKLAEKIKCLATVSNAICTVLITTAVTTSSASISTFLSGWD